MADKGKFIVLEGIDGCGKSTQADLLYHYLMEKYPQKRFELHREATDGPVGKLLREEYLSGKRNCPEEMINLLYLADRYEHIFGEDGILNKLNDGVNIICDRFYYSSFVYDTYMNYPTFDDLSATMYDEWNESFKKILGRNAMFLDAVVPDLVVWITTPAGIACDRISNNRNDRSIYEDIGKLSSMGYAYERVIKLFTDDRSTMYYDEAQDLGIKKSWMTKRLIVAGTESVESIAETIFDEVVSIFEPNQKSPRMMLNPNPTVVEKVMKRIWMNDGYCPCQPEQTPDTKCPCTDFYKGECHCHLYLKSEE